MISTEDGPIEEQVHRIIGGEAVRHAIDPVGGETGTQLLRSLSGGGRLVLYGTLSDQPIQVDPRLIISGPRVVEGFWLGHWMRQRSIPAALLLFREIAALVRKGVLSSEIGKTLPVAEIQAAAREAASVGRQGKVLLKLGQDS